jgi:methionyl-tRNA synthetase
MSYDHFIRTTDIQHIKFVQTAIESIVKSEQRSDIYLGSYEGYYSIREESYISDSDAKLTDYKDPVTDKPYEFISEPSYYFKLASYYDFIKFNLNDNQPIMPLDLNNQLIDSLSEMELRDLSISRTTFDWGIKFPNTSDHIVYVWFDALLNYLSGADVIYKSELDLDKITPEKIRPDKIIHIIGKDIVWFHAIIYPAILKSIGAE